MSTQAAIERLCGLFMDLIYSRCRRLRTYLRTYVYYVSAVQYCCKVYWSRYISVSLIDVRSVFDDSHTVLRIAWRCLRLCT